MKKFPWSLSWAPNFSLFVVLLFGADSTAQIFQLAELNTEQIRALDRAKTAILIPGGIVEEHGPYLPSFTDGYADAAFTQELARSIVARPGWTPVIFPQIPLGFGGANNIGDNWSFPGTYTVAWRPCAPSTWIWGMSWERRASAGFSLSTIMAIR